MGKSRSASPLDFCANENVLNRKKRIFMKSLLIARPFFFLNISILLISQKLFFKFKSQPVLTRRPSQCILHRRYPSHSALSEAWHRGALRVPSASLRVEYFSFGSDGDLMGLFAV